MLLSFANLWQQEELADVALVLQTVVPPGREHGEGSILPVPPTILRKMPAHKVLLSTSSYFKAQVQAWQQQAQQASAAVNTTTATTSPGATVASSLVVTLTLDSPQEETAALAILEAMYGAKPIPQILSDSSCTQQLDIAVLADKLHLPAICAPAVHGLVAACKGCQVSAATVAQHLASKQHVPGCLLPLVRQLFSSYEAAKDSFPVEPLQQILLAVLGDLEAVWAEEGLAAVLLDLSLSVMLLLLNMDGLQVASEDTVLFTAEAYLRHKHPSAGAQRDAAQLQLSRCIRCPHLSRFWLLSAVVASSSKEPRQQQHILGQLHPHLVELASLQLASLQLATGNKLAAAACGGSSTDVGSKGSTTEGSAGAVLPAMQASQLLHNCPPSWHKGPRLTKPLPAGVTVAWRLPVSDLVTFCRDGFAKVSAGKLQEIAPLSSTSSSPPLGGLAWRPRFELLTDAEGGLLLGLYAGPVNAPPNMFYSFSYKLTCHAVLQGFQREGQSGYTKDSRGCGWADFFELGPMVGGWDEVAWMSKGLPTDGELLVELTVGSVGHAAM